MEGEVDTGWVPLLAHLRRICLGDVSNEAFTDEINKILSVVIKCDEELKNGSCGNCIDFVEQLLIIVSNCILKDVNVFKTSSVVVMSASELILKFFLQQLKSTANDAGRKQEMYIALLEGFCKPSMFLSSTQIKDSFDILEKLAKPNFAPYNDLSGFKQPQFSTRKLFSTVGNHTQYLCKDILDVGSQTSKEKSEWQGVFCNFCKDVLDRNGALDIFIDVSLRYETFQMLAKSFDGMHKHEESIGSITASDVACLADELGYIANMFSVPLQPRSDVETAQRLFDVAKQCLSSAMFIAAKLFGKVNDGESWMPLNGGDADGAMRDIVEICGKFSWKAFEKSLSIITNVQSLIGGQISHVVNQNFQILMLELLIEGLQYCVVSHSQNGLACIERSIGLHKWFDGMCIIVVSMISRIVSLFTSLLEEIGRGYPLVAAASDTDVSTLSLTLKSQGHLRIRLQNLMSKLHIPKVLFNAFNIVYNKAVQLAVLIEKAEANECITSSNDDTDSTMQDGELKGSSSEESCEEDGLLLGSWLKQTMSSSAASPQINESNSQESKQMKLCETYSQSLEIFVLLAGSLLDFSFTLYASCKIHSWVDIVKRSLTSEVFNSINDVILQTNSTDVSFESKEMLLCQHSHLIISLYQAGMIDIQHIESVFIKTGISLEGDTEWPLYMERHLLILFTKIALQEQENCLNENKPTDTKRVIGAWKKFIEGLANATIAETDDLKIAVTDVNAEYLQAMLLLYHNLSTEAKANIINTCINTIIKISDAKAIHNTVALHRLLSIIKYLLMSDQVDPVVIFEQVLHNVLQLSSKSELKMFIDTSTENIIKESMPKARTRFYKLTEDDTLQLSNNMYNLVFTHSYAALYNAMIAVTTSLLDKMAALLTKSKAIFQFLSAKSCLSSLIELFYALPPTSEVFDSFKNTQSIASDAGKFLVFLNWLPLLVNGSKDLLDHKGYCVAMTHFDEALSTSLDSLSPVINQSDFISQLCSHCFESCIANSLSTYKSVLLTDALLVCLKSFGRGKAFLSGKEQSSQSQQLLASTWKLIPATQIEILKHLQETIPPNKRTYDLDEFEACCKLLMIDAGQDKDSDINNTVLELLPVSYKNAVKTWQDISLAPFPASKSIPKSDDGYVSPLKVHQRLVSFVNAQGMLSNGGNVIHAFLLKHFFKMQINFCHAIIKANKKTDTSITESSSMAQPFNTLIDIVSNAVLNYVGKEVNKMIGLLCSSQKDTVEDFKLYNAVATCSYYLVDQIGNRESDCSSCGLADYCIEYLSSLLENQEGCNAVRGYYNNHQDQIVTIALGGRLPCFSQFYCTTVLKILSNLIEIKPSEGDSEGIAQRLSTQPINELENWITRCLLTTENNANHLRIVCVAIVKKNSQDVMAVLLKILSNFVDACVNGSVLENAELALSTVMDIATAAGSEDGGRGHLQLIRSILDWIPQCNHQFTLLLDADKTVSESRQGPLMACTDSLLEYLGKILHSFDGIGLKDATVLNVDDKDFKDKDQNWLDLHDDIDEDSDESGGEESDEEALCNRLCTFTVTQRDFMNQHWYHCHTCKMNDGVGCCTICAQVCHKDHDVTYAKYGSFFCDCAAKEDGSCKSLVKRPPHVSPVEKESLRQQGNQSRSNKATKQTELQKIAATGKETAQNDSIQAIQDVKENMLTLLQDPDAAKHLLAFLDVCQKYFNKNSEVLQNKLNSKIRLDDALKSLREELKKIDQTDALLGSVMGSQDSAFDAVKLNFSGDQGQVLRQLVTSQKIYQNPMCLLTSVLGRRQQLAVAHDKTKVTIVQLNGLIRQVEGSSKKITMNRLSSINLPFTIISLANNPCNEDVVAVCGLKDCHILCLGNSDTVTKHLVLPSETSDYIVKAVWLPGTQTQLALLTSDFIRIYDLSKDITSPQYNFVLPSGCVRDGTFAKIDEALYLIVMSSQGRLHVQILDESSAVASSDPFFLISVLNVNHDIVTRQPDEDGNSDVSGVSVFYSHAFQMLFFSYNKGDSFAATLDKDISGTDKVFRITPSSSQDVSLYNWQETYNHPGLLQCMQNNGPPLLITIEPKNVIRQEVKNSSSKGKILSVLCHDYSSSHPTSDSHTGVKSVAILLLDDGTIRLQRINSNMANYWMKSVSQNISCVTQKQKVKKVKLTKYAIESSSTGTNFLIDFFEHCQPSDFRNIEFGGADLLHVYNAQQVKHRLNSADMYVACTKPSGFSVTITNTNAATVMVGLRIHVGSLSLSSAPSSIEVFGRIIPVKITRNRWFDVPFLHSESLSASKTMTVKFGGSSDPGGVCTIDCIKVYTKTKESIGWLQQSSNAVTAPASPEAQLDSPNPSPVHLNEAVKSITVDKLLLQSLKVSNGLLSINPGQMNDFPSRGNLLHVASDLLTLQHLDDIHNESRHLLANLFSSRMDFNKEEDNIRLSHALAIFKPLCQKTEFSYVDVEQLNLVLDIIQSVGRVRPSSLAALNISTDIAVQLSDCFWSLHQCQPSHLIVASLTKRAFGNLDRTAESLAGVLYFTVRGDNSSIDIVADLIVKLLLCKDQSVAFAAKEGLSNAMQAKTNLGSVVESSGEGLGTSSPMEETEDDKENEDDNGESEEIFLEINTPQDNDAAEHDNAISGSSNLIQEFLTEDQDMMEIALALSLHEQGQVNTEDFPPLTNSNADSVDTLDNGSQGVSRQGSEVSSDAEATTDNIQSTPEHQLSDTEITSDSPKPFEQADQCSIIQPNHQPANSASPVTAAFWHQLIEKFLSHFPKLKEGSGIQAIPFCQVLLMLCSNLNTSEQDANCLRHIVDVCLVQIKQTPEGADKYDASVRSLNSEIQLVVLRLLSVLMARYKTVNSGATASTQSAATTSQNSSANDITPSVSHGQIVANILAENGIIDQCLALLKNLLVYWQRVKVAEQEGDSPLGEKRSLLSASPSYATPDMSPFFLKQYVKSHAVDLLESFPQLITEIVLRLPYQVRKFCEATPSTSLGGMFNDEWRHVLCEYIVTSQTPFVRRQVRKLLLALCGSKEKYRFVKDVHTFRMHIGLMKKLLNDLGLHSLKCFPERVIPMSYETTVQLTDYAKSCVEVAVVRKENWQLFCSKEPDVLPFLVESSCHLSEYISGILLHLLGLALIVPEKEGKEGKSKAAGKALSVVLASSLISQLFDNHDSYLLMAFIKCFLLDSNSTGIRWQAHCLLHNVYKNVTVSQQQDILMLVWQLWKHVPEAGQKASQFVDLLGYFTIKTESINEKIDTFTSNALSLLHKANEVLLNHPNATLYKRLPHVVEVDGYYLESDPCLVCNNPEVPFTTMKLTTAKSDIKYTTTSQLVKLNLSYTISKLSLRITDVKRAKMVKSIVIHYNNRPVPSVVELKNKRGIWQKAKRVNLTPGQTDIKAEFTLPIVACNLMIEYADFYDNVQLSTETLQCPRCSANVPAHPGICGNCGENVYQCHKCRAINYDERDPFLCTSCGFCKYAKFECSLVARPCAEVESVENEDDRQKALSSVNSLLEKADKIYVLLTGHRHSLERLLRLGNDQDVKQSSKQEKTSAAPSTTAWQVSQPNTIASAPASSTNAASASSSTSSISVNKTIQLIAQKYGTECKMSFEALSKIIQKVTATRKELLDYDNKQHDVLMTVMSSTPEPLPSPSTSSHFQMSSLHRQISGGKTDVVLYPSESEESVFCVSKCYGCALATVKHSLTVLRALSMLDGTYKIMLNEGLLQELLEHNLQQGQRDVVSLARTMLYLLTKDNPIATDNLNQMITDHVQLALQTHAANMTSEVSLVNELLVLSYTVASGDKCWEQRLRCVFQIFLESVQRRDPDVLEGITLPCLRILLNTAQATSKPSDAKISPFEMPMRCIDASLWLSGDASASFDTWKTSHNSSNGVQPAADAAKQSLPSDSWLRLLLFSPTSQAIRNTICIVLESLCKVPEKKHQILGLLTSYLDELHFAGENAMEYLVLYKLLLSQQDCRSYLTSYNVLGKLTELIQSEVDFLSELESSTLSFDLSRGFALHALSDLLQSFFKDEMMRSSHKMDYIAVILHCYLSLRRLVVQRTKRIDEAQEMLLTLLEHLAADSVSEEFSFMKVCMDALKKCAIHDIRTPVFIFERLCNIIYKEEKEVKDFFVILEKDPQQEDFLQGRMLGNPYSAKDAGLGPLMRDVKNKICTECELVALLEDDTGMELLVNNKIISLDLPVAEVFKKIWCAKGERQDAMKIVYRMRGLLGDATEDMVDSLDNRKGKDVDEEREFAKASVLSSGNGLDLILKRLSYIKDLSQAQQLVLVILKLLEYCVKVKVNRQYLCQPSVNALKIMLGTLNLALRLERDSGSSSGGAMIAERLLKIMEIILHEASAHAQEFQLPSLPGDSSQLEHLLGHITSHYVKSNAKVLQAMMRLIPFLTFGSEQNMETLIHHFLPYMDFERFDQERSADETLYLDCFSVIASGISKSLSGSKLKSLILRSDILARALEHLKKHTPPKSFSASGILDAAKWKDFLTRPSLPYILRMLTGISRDHEGAQLLIGTDENVSVFHRLEQVSSEGMVGSLAENLMEALRQDRRVEKTVMSVRRHTNDEKRKMAMAMRQKHLEALGMVITDKGQIKAKPSPVIKEMEELLEEKGLVCCICREGYKFHPTKVLGIYTYSTRCVLDDFENKPRKSQGYSTVSHFNVVHFDCHSEAVRHARARDEWESASLQNADTKCNGLLPIWGPKVSEPAFASCLARHNGYIQECTGFREPTLHSYCHDLRLLITRFAQEKSFSDEAGGGGRSSNLFLIPYLTNVALYTLNTSRQRAVEEKIIASFFETPEAKWIDNSYEVDGPMFIAVLALIVIKYDDWLTKRHVMLSRILATVHVRAVSAKPKKRLGDFDVKDFSVYKSSLVYFYLVDNFHRILKGDVSEKGDDWPQTMSNYLRHNDEKLLTNCEKLLQTYEQDILPCESFGEFFDVAGLLEQFPDPDGFVKGVLESLKSIEEASR